MSEQELHSPHANEAPEQADKDSHIQELRAEVDEIVDKIGNPMDEGIKETVTYFMANGFPTVASCEGHVSKKEGEGEESVAPWVDIEELEPRGWKENKNTEREWKLGNAELQRRMYMLLDEFYQERHVPSDVRLVISMISDQGAFRVSNQGRGFAELLPAEKQTELQPVYRKEMADFTDLLKQKYYSDS